MLAAHAAAAILARRQGEQFESALATRDRIGQAKGIIMERYGVDDTRAFAMLRQLSQESNVKLADLASQVIATRIEWAVPRGDPRDTSSIRFVTERADFGVTTPGTSGPRGGGVGFLLNRRVRAAEAFGHPAIPHYPYPRISADRPAKPKRGL